MRYSMQAVICEVCGVVGFIACSSILESRKYYYYVVNIMDDFGEVGDVCSFLRT